MDKETEKICMMKAENYDLITQRTILTVKAQQLDALINDNAKKIINYENTLKDKNKEKNNVQSSS